MTDLPPDEVEAICAAWSERVRSDALSENGQDFRAGWVAAREYSKQREKELQEALERCRKAHARPAPLRPLIELERIQQEDSDGCGVAVLAMLTGQTYAQVDAEWPLRLTDRWTASDVKPHMMMDYLWKRGYSLLVIRDRRYAIYGAWPSIEPFAPMHYAMVDSPTQSTGHWIAIDGFGEVLDPFEGSRKTLDIYERMHEVVGVWPSSRAALAENGDRDA